MVENKNISGADEKILFPYINDPNPVQQVGHPTDIGYEKVKAFNNRLIREANLEDAYVKSLSISNTYSSAITVDLYLYKGREDNQGVYSYSNYYIIKNVSILAGSTLILDEEDLCLVDLQTFGLKIKLGESTHTASVFVTGVLPELSHINEGENRTSY